MCCGGAVVEVQPRRGLEIPYDGDGQLGIGGDAWVENLRGRGVGHQAGLFRCKKFQNYFAVYAWSITFRRNKKN